MDREQAVAVLDTDETVDVRAVEQMAAQRGAAVIGGEAGRQDEAEASAARTQRQRALEKQLIQVGVAVALQRVDADAAREAPPARVARRTPSPMIAAQHLPRRIADDRVEAGPRRAARRRREKTSGTPASSERTARAPRVARLVEQRRRHVLAGERPSRPSSVHQRAEQAGSKRGPSLPVRTSRRTTGRRPPSSVRAARRRRRAPPASAPCARTCSSVSSGSGRKRQPRRRRRADRRVEASSVSKSGRRGRGR